MMSKALHILFFCCWASLGLLAQIQEDFSDGSLLNDPPWKGDTSDFVINDHFELQLNAATQGSSFIYTSILWNETKSWSLDLTLDFAPSTANRVRIFLFIDTTDLNAATGYFIELGEGGESDPLRLYYINKGVESLLASGSMAHAANPTLKIEVRLNNQEWSISSRDRISMATSQELQIEHQSSSVSETGYFGLFCNYTSTRTNKFFFDNIIVAQDSSSDDSPPELLDLEVSTPEQLILTFSETLDKLAAENIEHYRLLPDDENPQAATLLADASMVQLDLRKSLINGQEYQLLGRDLADIDGNIASFNYDFTYDLPDEVSPYDILITEIFDDPTPVIGLPNAEFIELWVNKPVLDLSQVKLRIGTKEILLPKITVRQGEYIVLHDLEEQSKFKEIAGAVAVENLPTLVNSGNDIQLLNEQGAVLHLANYDDNWYQESAKASGGWSLELINPADPCALSQNWKASQNLLGGTPGFQNSVFDLNTIPTTPKVTSALPSQDSAVIRITLNKSHLTKVTPNLFSISEGVQVIGTEVFGRGQNEIAIAVEPPLVAGKEYLLSFPSLLDCTGSSFASREIRVRLPQKTEAGDLVVSEVLFDPKLGGKDFIELYNRSSKAVRLSDLVIANQSNQKVERMVKPFLITSGSYVVLTPDATQLALQYKVVRPEWVVETDLPDFNNDEGNVTILSAVGNDNLIIDAFDYSDKMHSALLKDVEGVSLERIDLSAETQNAANWHSASQASGYATPTGVNSQERSVNSPSSWKVDPSVFSPDSDGFDDYMIIQYADLPVGSYAQIKIFDAAGRLVKYLANNLSLSTTGFIQWDGSSDLGTKAPIGIYTIYIEVFDLTGKVNQLKKTCVVAARLN
jgi:hypothetical protein